MQPKHVKEAFRLLNKSIVRVETPDIQFEEDEEPVENGEQTHCFSFLLLTSMVYTGYADDDEMNDEDDERAVNGHGPMNGHDETGKKAGVHGSQPKQATRITYEEYKALATLLVMHCRQQEEKADTETSDGSEVCYECCQQVCLCLSV